MNFRQDIFFEAQKPYTTGDQAKRTCNMRRGNNNMLNGTIPAPIIQEAQATMAISRATTRVWAQTSYAGNYQKAPVNKEEKYMDRKYNAHPGTQPMLHK